MNRIPKQGEFYRHFKNKLYQVIAVAEHSETGESMVVYQALYGNYGVYVRPLSMFISEVDHEKYPEVQQKYRFEQVVPGKNKDTDMERMKQTDVLLAETAGEEVNPWLMDFLEADAGQDQLVALDQMRGRVGEQELESVALVLDIQLKEGRTVEEHLQDIRRCIEMQMRYDGGHLR